MNYEQEIEQIESEWSFKDTCSPDGRYIELLKDFEKLLALAKKMQEELVLLQYRQKYLDIWLSREWIPCSERLPEKPCAYPVTDYFKSMGDRFVDVVGYRGNGKWFDGDEDVTDRIIAWMPLPEPWRG